MPLPQISSSTKTGLQNLYIQGRGLQEEVNLPQIANKVQSIKKKRPNPKINPESLSIRGRFIQPEERLPELMSSFHRRMEYGPQSNRTPRRFIIMLNDVPGYVDSDGKVITEN